MIIAIIIGLTILVIVSWLLISNRFVKILLGSLSTILLLASVLALSANWHSHWGMKQVTDREVSKDIYTAGQVDSPLSMVISQEIGTDSGNYVLVYRDSKEAKKAEPHFTPDKKDIVQSVKKTATYKLENVSKAKLTTTRTYWTWKNEWFEKLLDVKGESESNLISEENVLELPKDSWIVLTSEQAEKLAQEQKNMNPSQAKEQEAMMKSYVQGKVEEFVMKNPKASPQEIKDFTQEETLKLTKDSIEKMIK